MNRMQTAFATLSLTACALAGGAAVAADPASTPTAAQQATPTPSAAEGGKITKSRSNIQNNREVAPPAKAPAAATPATDQSVVKTKTKSNQSND